MVAEASKQGITVSDVEIRERILALPGFQENGQFVGESRYRQILQFQNPPMTHGAISRRACAARCRSKSCAPRSRAGCR